MSPDHLFYLALAAKIAVAAGFVVAASLITERAGPVIGALVSTLPVSAGPGYVFLALDHEAGFIATSAKASLALNAATCAFALVFVVVAQRHPLPLSLASALAVWFGMAYLAQPALWSIEAAVLANILAFTVSIALTRRYASVEMPLAVRRWYDIPLRASLVGGLVALLVTLSGRLGPDLAGVIAVFPMVLTSLMLILQPRIGGPATGAVIANTLSGLIGFALALGFVHVSAVPVGKWMALLGGLGVAVLWNFGLWTFWRGGGVARIALMLRRLRGR